MALELITAGESHGPGLTCIVQGTPAALVGTQKYGLTDVRDILERASARETAARVAGGAVCKAFLAAVGVRVFSHVIQITGVEAPRRHDLTAADFDHVDESPVRCLDVEAGAA